MALDGIFLNALYNELKCIIDGRIDKVNQPEKDEVILGIRCSSYSKKLLISSSSSYPRIHFTNITKPNPIQAPMFCMVLRKYLVGGRIIDVHQLGNDRILIIDVENTDEMGFNSIYSIIIEIMGRHSNISLVRQRDNIVMDSIKHITPDINTYRCLYPNTTYVYPPSTDKLNPMSFSYDEFESYIKSHELSFNEKLFSNVFSGVSSLVSKELHGLCLKEISNEWKAYYDVCSAFFSKMKNSSFEFTLYFDDKNNYKDFHCINLQVLKHLNTKSFNTASGLLDTFYYEKDKQDRLNQKSSDLHKLLMNNIERCNKKFAILTHTLEECKEKDKYSLFGELLTANFYSLKVGEKSVKLLNYYTDNGEYVDIPLDSNKTPSENIQYYYKKYNKLKKSEEGAILQLKINQDELDYLNSVLTNVSASENYDDIEEIRRELVESGYIRYKKSSKKNKIKPSRPLHFKSNDGIEIYVGKNNIQNDHLTLKFADKTDTWLHTKNIPGSHVIIKAKAKDIPDNTLTEAAILAAFYSKASNSTKVPVDYTEVRNVKKPAGAKPGMVIYSTNKTLYVDPYDIKLEKI